MNDLEFKQQVLDPLSASFCAAKWYNATIWLGSGQTTSCHHPPAHLIDTDKVSNNSRLLHNTDQKKEDRRKMLAGERPAGCEYCWKIEDMHTDAVSDRVYKSKIYPIEALHEAVNTPIQDDVNLKTLEISFDRTCQLACSYCNPAFSSTWVNDIKRNGPYQSLVSDGRNHFTHAHDSAQLYRFGETNPYIEAFFEWWETDLHRTLQELRITGGEPLMSGYTWKLIEWFKTNQGRSNTKLAINSNLGIDQDKIKDFAVAVAPLPKVDLYTSMEATFVQAEYIRDGLDYDQWLNNVLFLLEGRFVSAVHVMCTINALCLDSLVDHLNMMLTLKQRYGRDQLNFTLNILRFPSFQSALVLPDHIRNGYRLQLEAWLFHNQDNPCLHEHEVNHVQRLIDYLDVVKTPHSEAFEMPKLLNDFKQFYTQYDQRRNKNFDRSFPELSAWYSSIQILSKQSKKLQG
jgi:organic radical activating enzyme